MRLTLTIAIVSTFMSVCCEKSPKATTVPSPLLIEVTGEKLRWHVRYPGPDGSQGTDDDFSTERHLTLAAGVPTKITLKSKDYVYGYELPDFDESEIAVPDLTFAIEFTPDRSGNFQVRGHQMCGYTHPKLMAELKILSVAEFAAWSSERSGSHN